MKKFDFKKALLEIGVSLDVCEDWIRVRKTKRATNTKTAFEAIEREINKAGLPANECITIAAENSWSGFRADWIKPKSNGKQSTSEALDNWISS